MINHKAIYALNPTVVTIRGEDAFDKDNNPVAYNKTTAAAWVDPEAYRDKRTAEYPSIGEQLDALFHAGVFPADMAATLRAVKNKYPKG